MSLETYMVTFGGGHIFKDHWLEFRVPYAVHFQGKTISAETMVRNYMHEHFGKKWSMIYEAPDFKPEFFSGGVLCTIEMDEYFNILHRTFGDTL